MISQRLFSSPTYRWFHLRFHCAFHPAICSRRKCRLPRYFRNKMWNVLQHIRIMLRIGRRWNCFAMQIFKYGMYAWLYFSFGIKAIAAHCEMQLDIVKFSLGLMNVFMPQKDSTCIYGFFGSAVLISARSFRMFIIVKERFRKSCRSVMQQNSFAHSGVPAYGSNVHPLR